MLVVCGHHLRANQHRSPRPYTPLSDPYGSKPAFGLALCGLAGGIIELIVFAGARARRRWADHARADGDRRRNRVFVIVAAVINLAAMVRCSRGGLPTADVPVAHGQAHRAPG